jgi:hypothetical protein
MGKCAAIKANGERCRLDARPGSDYCYNHSPEFAEQRRRHGRKGGKRGGRGRPLGEVQTVKAELKRIIDAIEKGAIDTRVGNAMFNGWNLVLRSLESERAWIETTELQQQVDELWQEREQERKRQRLQKLSGGTRP